MKKNPLAESLAEALAAHISPVLKAIEKGDEPKIEPVMTLRPVAADSREYELLVYGDIGESWWGESVTAKSVVDQLNALGSDVSQINVRVNSYGGSVSDGLAIYNALRRAKARKVVTVDGVAMSSASLIAMAGDEVLVSEASMFMVHAPWGGAVGNARDMRQFADVLDTFAEAMAGAYARKTGKTREDVLALLTDGEDHYYTGEQAVAEGFADGVVDVEGEPTTDEQARAFASGLLQRFLTKAPEDVARVAIAAAHRPRPGAQSVAGASRTEGDTRTTTQAAETGGTRYPISELQRIAASVCTQPTEGDTPMPAPIAAADSAEIQAQAIAAVRARNEQIEAALASVIDCPGMREHQSKAFKDPSMSIDDVYKEALRIQQSQASPASGGSPRVEAGADKADKEREAMENWILARASAESKESTDKVVKPDGANPFRGFSLYQMAEHRLRASGVNTSAMTRTEMVGHAMGRSGNVRGAAGHTTSDFPILLENTLNKLLIAAYQGANTTWQRFCRIGDLSDFRAHGRYRVGSFGDLLEVNEAGNYKQGTVSDAEKETITAKRKGRMLVITREMIVNDDLQAFADIVRGLGRVANRTIDKDVFALFALNSGAGPTMSDGNPLFHASHSNIAATSAIPSMASFEAARVLMAQQTDVGANDYIDVRPSIWLGPLSKSGEARSVNGSQYDPDATSKLQKPNIVLGLFSDIVDTPRLSGTAWYALAAPGEEPVFEVGFVNGQRNPVVEQMTDFDSDGLKWKVVHEYGVAAIGWRGAVKNAGA